MLQTIWEWVVFVYVEELIIPILNNPVPFYLALAGIALLVSTTSRRWS